MKFKFSIIRNLKPLKTYLVQIFIVLIVGCLSMKPATAQSNKNLFKTFFVGESGTQYFIKPLTFIDSQSKDEIHIDFTFRYKNVIKDSVIVNLSILSSNIVKRIDSLSFSNTTLNIISNKVELLFNEKRNKLFNSRFTTKISLVELNKMFESDDWNITITNIGTYTSHKRTKKAIKRLRDEIFILF